MKITKYKDLGTKEISLHQNSSDSSAQHRQVAHMEENDQCSVQPWQTSPQEIFVSRNHRLVHVENLCTNLVKYDWLDYRKQTTQNLAMVKIHNEVFLVLLFRMGNGLHSMY